MKLSRHETLVLELLTGAGESYGLELVAASGGALTRGGIYLTLNRMEQKGLVSSEAADDGRRLYRLSGLGKRAREVVGLVGDLIVRGQSS